MEDNKFFYHKDIIYTVYQEQSFSKAAKKLFISQPSLSVIVKKLEDDIGAPLFDRSYKPIRLTEVGEAYIKAASDIQNTEENFLEYIGALSKLDAGSLRIGSTQLFSSFVLPKYIAEFMRLYPNIKVSLLDASSPTLENAIMLGDIDLVIDNQELDEELFFNREIGQETLLLAVPAEYACNAALAKYKLSYQDVLENSSRLKMVECVPLNAFRNVPFTLMTKDNDTRTRTDAIFRDAGFEPKVILEIDRLITQYNFLTTFSSASIVSDTLLRHVSGLASEEEGRIVFYKLPEKYAERKIVLSYKKGKHYSRAMDAFAHLINDFA